MPRKERRTYKRPTEIVCADCGKVTPVPNDCGRLPIYCPDCSRLRRSCRSLDQNEQRKIIRRRRKAAAIMRGEEPEMTSKEIREIAEAEAQKTGHYPHYGEVASRPYLEQQAREMEKRRRQMKF